MRTISVVVLGPMGGEKQGAGQVPVQEHMRNMVSAVNQCAINLRFVGKPLRPVPVTAEKNPGGAISPFVLMHIDQADVAIVDISVRSPSVMYEIAILHALGKPTVLIDYTSQVGDPPFYLKGQQIRGVSDFTVEELTRAFMEVFSAFIAEGVAGAVWANAISDFYTVPLSDAFAASGLATGHFHNFIRWIISDGYGAITLLQGGHDPQIGPLSQLIIIRPKSLQEVDETKAALGRIAGYRSNVRLSSPNFPRGAVVLNVLPPYIVDFPQPLESINSSLSFTRLRELLIDMNPAESEREVEKFEGRIIANYFETLLRLARKTAGCNQRKLRFMTVEEVEALARA